jgi:thiopeptide-type bacteriocin biosynthesis protein
MNYNYHSKLILRTPLKPIKTSFSVGELKQLFTQKEIQEALFLSSPNLLNEFEKWKKGELTNKVEEEKLINSLLKYALRMHNRCTPFGLFAGCGVVKNSENNIVINTGGKRKTHLDMNFTCALAQELTKLPFIKKHLKFYPNTSLYSLQDKIRYVEYYYKNERRIHQISAVDSSVYLQNIIKSAQSGATLEQLVNSIVSEDIALEEAFTFVSQIIDFQLLISELEPSVTGGELLTRLLKVLYSIQEKELNKELESSIQLLQNTQIQLDKIDEEVGNSVSVYQDLAENLKQLKVPFELNKLFQTDLYIKIQKENKDDNISKIEACNKTIIQEQNPQNDELKDEGEFEENSIQQQLTKAITVLNKLTSSPAKTNLSEFRNKFYERYEDKEVALLDALDIETGIGYAQNNNHTGDVNPLVNDVLLPDDNNQDTELIWNKKQSFLLHKLLKAQKNKKQRIQLTIKELSEFKANWDDLPDSFSVMYTHLGKQEGKDVLSISNVGGSSATHLLGRFASSNTKISELVTEIAVTEQQNNPNVIFAEIAHLPESRTGNILMRPAFRKYEIPYLSNSSLPKEQQITLDDLYLSVKYDQIVLRSKRLNKQIIPRLGNAHNFSFNALPVYHFLCDLQTQNMRGGLFFDWGNLTSEFSFLPRVEVENVIISFATWQLQKKQYEVLFKKGGDLNKEISTWQKEWELPNLILLIEGDNELLINLTDKLSVEMFVSILKKRPNIILKEFLFDEKTAFVKDKKGNAYTNELIAILQKKPDVSLQIEQPQAKHTQIKEKIPLQHFGYAQWSTEHAETVSRTFSIGSEWLYYKIYCGVKTTDTILTEVIKPLTELLIKQQLIDNWFFIRYADPDIHLRVRFHFTNLKHIGAAIDLFQKAIAAYEENGLIWKVQTDTYQREIERYGQNAMLLGEQIFYYDSKCIVDLLDMIDGDEGEEIRWLFAIRMVDTLLVDFNYSEEQKRDLLEDLKTSFALEFNMNKDLKRQLDKKFRTYRISIVDILDVKNDKTSELKTLFEILNKKSIHIKPIVNQILELHQNNQLPLSLNNLLASYIHMLLNRLFKNKQRLHEMVVYDLMWRTYRSEIAKEKSIKNQLINS